jgi:hypothetical protein
MKINGLGKAATNGTNRFPSGPAKIRSIRGCFCSFERVIFGIEAAKHPLCVTFLCVLCNLCVDLLLSLVYGKD